METNPFQSPQTEILPLEATPHHPGDPFLSAVKVGVLLQIAIFIFTVLMLDGGWTNKLCIMSMIGYWIAVLAIRIRRGAKPTAGDLLFLRYGVAMLFVLSIAVARLVYSIIVDE
jgi:hypothetical protein